MSLLEKINEKEVLRYLGFKNKDADEFTAKTIEEMSSLVFEKAQIKYVYQKFELEKDEDFCLKNTVFNLQGEDIKKLLEECNFCVVMAATLGGEIDTEIRKMQIRDMAKAVILDACASSAIENVCDNLQKHIEDEFDGYYATRRFSPGYGDMPLESQKMLCNVLQTHKNTGIAIN
ncbi:MAG: 5-methyltetrahydrofolate--homocysteine methyltransferase, partial [Firmicutes bacterium]|nr:5-methyltetrahydrofolate--homocysteine methyltransferase [Bacillota bacterium]